MNNYNHQIGFWTAEAADVQKILCPTIIMIRLVPPNHVSDFDGVCLWLSVFQLCVLGEALFEIDKVGRITESDDIEIVLYDILDRNWVVSEVLEELWKDIDGSEGVAVEP